MDVDKLATIAADVEKYANLVLLAVLGVCLLLMAYGSVVKNSWGVNFRRVACPDCGTVMALVRMPKSGKQALWGGYTCPSCQCEMDKWGRRSASS